MIAAREGVHWDSTLKFVSRIPSAASVSSRGVGAPRMMPPPLKPGSPQPKLSMKTRTMFGFLAANADPTVIVSATNTANTVINNLFKFFISLSSFMISPPIDALG
jgi:hypothetical protein